MNRLRDWWAQGAFVEIQGHRIFTRVQGAGPTLVFLHGFPTSSHDWAEVIGDLALDHRCVTFDYLGYGASDKPTHADYSSVAQTDRALAVLRRLDVGEATVIGHDLGGILLQQLLHRAAESTIVAGAGSLISPVTRSVTGSQTAADAAMRLVIIRAIFVNSSVYAELYRPTPRQLQLIDPIEGPPIARRISRATLAAAMAAMLPKHPPDEDRLDDLWQAVSLKDGHHLWPQHLVYMAERAAAGAAWAATLRRTAVPLSFIYGLADPISGAQILSHAQADLPSACCIGLADLGHYPHLESPADFITALRTVLPRA